MKKIFTLCVLLTIIGAKSRGQVANYTFAQSSGTYTAISGGTGSTTLFNPSWDDEIVNSITIPFSFAFNGASYTSCSVSANGFLTFGGIPTGSIKGPISSGASYDGAFAGFALDLQSNSSSSTVISRTTGSAPNRVFVVQWNNARRYSFTGDVINFQLRLYETSNKLEIIYGSSSTSTSANSNSTQVGLRGNDNTDFNNRTGGSNTRWDALSAGTSNDATVNFKNSATSGNIVPASGLTFTWTPCPTISVSSQPNSQAVCAGQPLSFSVNATNATGYQWRKNGTSISGATTSTFSIASVTAADAGSYDVVISNNCSSKTSDAATATINALPSAVTITPGSATICAGTVQQLTTGGSSSGSLLSENFNASTNNWTRINNSTSAFGNTSRSAWTLRPNNYTYTEFLGFTDVFHSNDNSQFYLSNSDDQGPGFLGVQSTNTTLTSPAINTTGYQSLSLTFSQNFLQGINLSDVCAVQVSTDGTNYSNVTTYTTNQGTEILDFVNGIYNYYLTPTTVDLSAYINKPTLYIRFKYTANFGFWWAIDNVGISGNNQGNITWSPITNLYTNAAATTPYIAGGIASSVYAKPSASTTYTATNSNGSCTTSSNVTVTVNPTPSVTTTQTASICSGKAFVVSPAGQPTGTTYTWAVPTYSGTTVSGGAAQTIGVASVAGTLTNTASTTGTATYTVTPKAGSCTGSPFSTVVTVNPLATASLIVPASACSGGNVSVAVSGTPNATIKFTVDGGNTITATLNSSGNFSGSYPVGSTTAPRTYTAHIVSVSAAVTGCENTPAVTDYSGTLYPASVAGSITGSTSVCANVNNTALTLSGYTGSIQWQSASSSNGTYSNIPGATAATYTATNLAATTYYKAVVTSGSCSLATTSLPATVTVKPLPTASLVLNPGSGAACVGSPVGVTLSGTAGSSITYSINPGSSNTVAANTGISSPNTAGDYAYTINSVTLNGCTGTVSNGTQIVHMVANPDATISTNQGTGYVQIGNAINLTGGTTNGAWTSDNGAIATIGSASGQVTGVASGTANIGYTVSRTAYGVTCSANSSRPVYVTADYITRNNGNFSDYLTWKRGTVNGLVNAASGEIPTLANTVEVQHDLTLDQNFQVGSNKSFIMSAAGTMTIQPGKIFSALGRVDFGHKSVTVKSTASGTGTIGQIAGTIANADNITVERYTDGGITAGRRAWRFITSPVKGQTIRQAWQEDGAINTDYGTLITGESLTSAQAAQTGFDYIGAGNHTSIRQYDSSINNWIPLTTNTTLGTQIPISSHQAYMVFVRGNRTVGASVAGPATVRAKGALFQGNQTVTIGSGNYTAVGNPYASSIDFGSIYLNNTATIKDQFYVWNSKYGTYGAYVLITHDGTNGGYKATPDVMSGVSAQDNNTYRYIPSGSGFLVARATNATSSTLTIREQDKAAGNLPTVSPFRVITEPTDLRQLEVNLNQKNSNSSMLVDGFRAKFSPDYEGNEEDNSALKPSNFNENLGLIRGGYTHILEAHADIKKTDTLQMKMWGVSYRSYELQIKGDNFTSTPGIKAWLEDSYLQTKQEIDLSGTVTTVGFDVNKDSGSWKNTRFRIVFENTVSALPVTLTGVKAVIQNGGVNVSWNVTNEVNIKGYTIEKSTDGGRSFTSLSSQQPAHNNANAAFTSYSGFDSKPMLGDNFYRIRIEAKNGVVSYSSVVKATIGGSGDIQIAVYPNPVKDGKVNLTLTNLATGAYLASVYSEGGQTVYQKKITVGAANATQSESLILGKGVAQGSYQLRVTDSQGKQIKDIKLMIGK